MNKRRFELRCVSKSYDGVPVISRISITIDAGQHVAILGPSGCGKSTTLRLLAGLEVPSEGQVLLDGTVISDGHRIVTPPHRRGVAMVFQDLALWPNLSAFENVVLGQAGSKCSRKEVRKQAKKALATCGIESLADRLPGTLSGGEQQRVALARAIAPQPDFLLLDEPFAGLDLVTKTKLLRDISALAKQRSFTILLVTHDPLETTSLCNSAVVLNRGRIEEMGSLQELLCDPKSELLRLFREQLN